MPEHEPESVGRDDLSGRKHEYRAARVEDGQAADASSVSGEAAIPSDDSLVASESMTPEATLSRLDTSDSDPGRVPPGRQISGQPPAV